MNTSIWAVVDTETTGVDIATAKIVEVAVALFRGGEPIEEPRSWLVNPGEPIPEEAAAIHGISDAMVAGAPSLEELLPDVCQVVRRAHLVAGYNCIHYDLPLMARLCGLVWLAAIDGMPVIDALVLIRHRAIGKFWKGPGRHRLSNVCARYGIEADGAHRAGADVLMTGRLLWALGPQVLDAGLPVEAGSLAAEIARLAPLQEADYLAWRARQDAKEAQGAP